MKKFINDPENLTSELLEGLALANKDIIHLEDGNLVVNNKLKDADRVTIVTLIASIQACGPGAAKTLPATEISTIPSPTKPLIAGSWPVPPKVTIAAG